MVNLQSLYINHVLTKINFLAALLQPCIQTETCSHTNCNSICWQSALQTGKSESQPLQTKPPDLFFVPSEHDLAKGFKKDLSHSLPPHKPYDCATNLFPFFHPGVYMIRPIQSNKLWKTIFSSDRYRSSTRLTPRS